MRKADEETLSKVRALIKEAHAKGLDSALLLDRHGVLSHSAGKREIMADALSGAAEVLDQLTLRQLAGQDRLATSPADVKRQAVSWLRKTAGEVQAL